jgi:restriction system protein
LNRSADLNLWDIYAGKTGDADSLFLKKNCVAVGWTKVGDWSALKPDRDAFKVRVAVVYPAARPRAVPNDAGQLFRFVHEMKRVRR